MEYKKIAFGVKWTQWSVGLDIHNTEYGRIYSFKFLPLQMLIAPSMNWSKYNLDQFAEAPHS